MVCDREGRSVVKEKTDISVILSDLGYTANDLMNVNFVLLLRENRIRADFLFF